MAFDAEVMNNKKSILNRIKLKIKGLLEDIDQLDDHGGDGPPSVAQFLTEVGSDWSSLNVLDEFIWYRILIFFTDRNF